MKTGKHFKLGVGLALLASLFFGFTAVSVAQEAADPNEVLTTTQERARPTLEERIAERKAALQTRLTAAQETRLESRCVAAQAKITGLNQRAATAITKRSEFYQEILAKLTALSDRLSDKVDTTALEAAIATLEQKADDFAAAAETYRQTLADLAELDCAADPTAFRASLDSAKTEQASVVAAAAAVRTQLQDVIKPLMQAIRAELAGETE